MFAFRKGLSVFLLAVLAVASFARAGEKSFVGDGTTAATKDWFVAANWDPAGIPGSDDDVTVSAKTVVATNAIAVGSLTLDAAANLTLGTAVTDSDQRDRPHVSANIAGNLTLAGASKLNVIAGEIQELSIFENKANSLAAIRAAANTVTIGGAFSVNDTATVYPEAAVLTGVPVFFRVTGDVSVAEGATFDTRKRGWGWSSGDWATRPVTNNVTRKSGEKTGRNWGWSLAYGCGWDRFSQANYGAESATSSASYGYSFAPFLPGSPSGNYSVSDSGARSGVANGRGPGTIVILSQGDMTVNGRLLADARITGDTAVDTDGPSGGGIWLAAKSFAFGANAKLSADAGEARGNGYHIPGRGGRICLCEDCTEEEIASMLNGTLPDTVLESPTIECVTASVLGGCYYGSTTSRSASGTLSHVRSATAKITLTVVITGTGTVTYGGTAHASTFDVQVTPKESQTLTASAAGENYFSSWIGDMITGYETYGSSVTFSTEVPTTVYANFASRTATARSWTGSVSTRWSLGDNWSPAGVPGSNDTVTISTGSPRIVGRSVTIGSLALSGGSLSLNDATTRGEDTLTTTGDLTLSGSAKLYVFAPELADMSVFAQLESDQDAVAAALWAHRKTVTVGGAFTLGGTSVVYPDSAPMSGVPVTFKAGSVSVAEGAKFDTKDRGWKWSDGTWSADLNAKPRMHEASWEAQGYTYAFGAGLNYNYKAGGYGSGTPSGYTRSGKTYYYGGAYCKSFAPFLPGSPGGLYGLGYASVRAPGSVVVYSVGDFVFNGSVVADGTAMDHYPTTGGGVWLATGGAFAFGANASISSNCGGKGAFGQLSSGGRIALAEGVTEEQMRTCASGTLAEGLTENPDITELTVSATPNGTLSYVRSASAKVQVGVVLAGDGQVTYGGETYATNFTFTATPNEDFTLVASAAGDVRFSLWNGDKVAGGESTAATLTTSTDVPTFLYATFVSDTPAARSWTGSLDTKWSHGANWSPAGLPGANDTVEIKKGTVQITDLSRTVASLVVSNATLKVGTEAARGRETLTVTGDATLGGGAKMYVYGSELEDLACFANQETDLTPVVTSIWTNAKIVTIGGSLTVAGSGTTVCPDDAPITGGAVVFRVGGDFTLGAGASFDASQLGWGWSTNAWSTHPAGAKPRVGNNVYQNQGWTLAPAPGLDYGAGAGYGHAGSGGPRVWGFWHYGGAYGYDLAPFLAGSPASWYGNKSTADERGSGAVVIFAKGTATVGGTIRSTPLKDKSDYGAQSGGGIWLCAKSFAFGAGAVLEAKGQDQGYYCPGGGGRIAVCTALSDAQIDSLARTGRAAGLAKGRVLDATAFATRYPDCTVSVLGGNSRTDIAGTFRYVAPKKGAVLRVR